MHITKAVAEMQPHTQAFVQHNEAVPEIEPFYERFSRVLEEGGLSDTEAAAIMGLSAPQISRIKKGVAGSIRFEDGLKLCDRLGIDAWYLAFGRERVFSPLVSEDRNDRLGRLEGEVQEIRGMLEAMATARAETLEAEVARDAQHIRRRSVGKR